MEILFTLMVGMFTFLGSIIIFVIKNNKKVVDFSITIGFGVLFALILLELIPETLELLQTRIQVVQSIVLVLLLVGLGIGVLKILDKFIPDHDASNNKNLVHIGIMTSIALVIHNILEGMAIYTSFNTSMKFGVLLSVGVALHNIPLGMSITSMFYKNGKDNKRALLMSVIVSLSTFVGGLIAWIFSGFMFEDFSKGIILSITLGMLIYIVLFELLEHVLEIKNKRITVFGVLLDFSLLIFSMLLG